MSEKSNSLEAIAHSEELAISQNSKAKRTRLLLSLVIGIGGTLALLGILTLFVKFIIDEPDAQLIAYQAQAPVQQTIKEKPKKIPPPTEEIPIISQNTNTAITIEVPEIEIPEIELDEMDLESEEFEMDLGSFDDMALDLGDMVDMSSMFGSKTINGNSLAGYLYDLKQIKDPKTGEFIESPMGIKFREAKAGPPFDSKVNIFYDEAKEFLTNDWDEKLLENYYKSPKPLLTAQFCIPRTSANEAPKAFDLQDSMKPAGWMIVYKGVVSAPYDCTLRFVGFADDILMVNLKGENIFYGNISDPLNLRDKINDVPKSENPMYSSRSQRLFKGKWVRVRKGEKMPIKIILGEVPGGGFTAHLAIEEKGEKYKQHQAGYPILPLFQTVKASFPEEVEQGKHNWEIMDTGFIFNN